MKKIAALLSLALVFSFASAFGGEFNVDIQDSIYNIKNLKLPSAKPAVQKIKSDLPTKVSAKKWTIMVFINGKNNLEMAGLFNVNQMEEVGSDKNVNIVVEIGRMKGQAEGDTDIDGNWTGSRRLYIKKDKDGEKITSPVIMETKTVDMGSYERVINFVKWTKKHYPAGKYMLVLWDHGTGWMDPQMEKKKKTLTKGISFDDETGNYIRTKQIAQILKESGGVDILAFDACLMQMAEVDYEAKDYASVIIGSEETEPAYGYPYDLFLKALERYPNMNAEKFAAVIVKSHKKFYKDIVKKASMLSAVRTNKLSKFAGLSSEFVALVKKVNDVGAVKKAGNNVIRYDIVGPKQDPDKTISFYGDIAQFAELLSANITKIGADAEALKVKSKELVDFIKRDLIIDSYGTGNERTGKSLSISGGISVYFPPVETKINQDRLERIFENKYQDFAFSKAANWHDFATYIYNAKPADKSKCVDPGKNASMKQIADYAACKTDEELGLK